MLSVLKVSSAYAEEQKFSICTISSDRFLDFNSARFVYIPYLVSNLPSVGDLSCFGYSLSGSLIFSSYPTLHCRGLYIWTSPTISFHGSRRPCHCIYLCITHLCTHCNYICPILSNSLQSIIFRIFHFRTFHKRRIKIFDTSTEKYTIDWYYAK